MAATYPEAPTGRSCGAAGPPERGPRSVHSRPRRTCLHSRGGRRLPVGVGERHREPMSRRTPHRMTARSPEDLFALAPIALGFHPEESLVMLTFGRTAFHARIDLPEGPEDRELVRDALLGPAVRHGVERVAFLVFSQRRSDPVLVRLLVTAFLERGIEVIDVLRSNGRRWFAAATGERGAGRAHDVRTHPFLAESVLRGVVTLPSRAALAEALAPDVEAVAAVARTLADLPPAVATAGVAQEVAWVVEAVSSRRALTDDEAGRLLRDLRDPRLRDAAWVLITRADADEHLAFLSDLVRRAPAGWVAPAAALAGFAAWLGGQGAWAWCAAERSLADDPGYGLARDLCLLLAQAVPPSRWEEVARCAVHDHA